MNNESSLKGELEIPEQDHSVFYSRDILEQKRQAGDFDRLRLQLHSFVQRHRSDILEVIDDVDVEFPDLDHRANTIASIRAFVEASQGVNPAAEMGDQIKEINKEIWYRGEEGQTDRREISQKWIQDHASRWRSARLQELLYLVDSEPDALIALIDEGDKT